MQTRLSSLVLAAALAACSSPSKGPQGPGSDTAGSGAASGSDTAGSGTASGTDPGTPVQHDGPGIGQPCGPEGLCAAGLACKKYYGIAGPRGPEFSSCEHACSSDADCDKGQRCATIADGPGQVCRGT